MLMGFFSFFSKKEKKETLDNGLQNTKTSVFSKIAHAVAGKSKVDDDILDELEGILVSSDVGVDTTLKIIDRIEKRNNAIHIVDYKTGKVYASQITLLDEQWDFLISDFKYSKAFQLLMYAYLLKKSGIISNESIAYAGNYSFKNLKNDFLYFKTDKKEICNITDDILKKFESKLIELLTEIYDITILFREKE